MQKGEERKKENKKEMGVVVVVVMVEKNKTLSTGSIRPPARRAPRN